MGNMSSAAQPNSAIVCVKFVPALQQVFVCERGSLAVKVYNQRMQLMAMLFVRMPAREEVREGCMVVCAQLSTLLAGDGFGIRITSDGTFEFIESG